MNKKTVRDIDVKGKKVLVRCDFNVPLKDGKIGDDTRIVSSLQTINYCLDKNAKVILFSHLGRVKEEADLEKNNLAPVAVRLQELLDKYNVEIPLWGMYKDDKHRTKGLISQEKEIELDKTSNLYRFVASIQEEVHNYAITYHRSLRNKSLTKSELDDIQGIGEKRKKALLNHFKDIEAIKKATFEELLDVEGMNKASSESVYNYFRKGN